MIVCPKCKEEIEADSLYCDQCGDELKICPQCQSLSRGKRCPQCGAAVVPKASGEAPGKKEVATQESLYLVHVLKGIRLPLIDGGIIGRKQGDYLSVFSGQMHVSGLHASLAKDKQNNRWSVTDHDSTNGTFVNNLPLAPEVPRFIEKGDRLRIADLEFVIE